MALEFQLDGLAIQMVSQELLPSSYVPYLQMESKRLSECLAALESYPFLGALMAFTHGWEEDSLDPLLARPHLQSLFLPTTIGDVTALQSLTQLRQVILGDIDQQIDLRHQTLLESLHLDWRNEHQGIDASRRLREFVAYGFLESGEGIQSLPMWPYLQHLTLHEARITSLKGIERFGWLSHLTITHARRLIDISSVSGMQIRSLCLDTCRRLSDWTVLESLRELETLVLVRCGPIPTLQFLNRLPNLRRLVFSGTNVEDGNLEPCLRLKSVVFDNKRHYSHRRKDIQSGP